MGSLVSFRYKDRLLPLSALAFFALLSVSFIPGYPLNPFFYIVDSIFSLFYLCFSLTLFKINQNIDPLIKSSLQLVGSRSINSLEEKRLVERSGTRTRTSTSSSISNDSFFFRHNRNLSMSQSDNCLMDVNPSSPLSNLAQSPMKKSPWSSHINMTSNASNFNDPDNEKDQNVLMGSLVREEGHIYSLAASGEFLYTGSDSKNIRVWKNQKEFSGFKSNSGLVKAIVIDKEMIFTGHQDGKIRVWKVSSKNNKVYKRVGTLPTFKDYIKSSIKPSSYVEANRRRNALWLKHLDAISCLSLSEDKKLLYSTSWDKTFKVWRISDMKCLESINAHDDAVNSLVAGFDGLVFTGSADGSIKVWRREMQGKGTKHFFSQTILKQECAVTALAINPKATIIYSGSSDGIVNFWERENTFAHCGVLRGHKLAVLCLAAAGNLVITGSADMGICVWKRMGNNHICLSMLNGHSGPVKCLAVEKDQESPPEESRWILYSGSLDKSVKMWRITEGAPSPVQDSGLKGTQASLCIAPSFATQGGRISVKNS